MVVQSLKDAYWDADRTSQLLFLIENYSSETCPNYELETFLLKQYEIEKFVVENGQLKYELVFDKNFIGFI